VQALSRASGREAAPLTEPPEGLAGLVFDGGLIAANCSLSPVSFSSCPAGAIILDTGQYRAAGQAEWLENAPRTTGGTVTLEPCACVFAFAGDMS
jgi:hypothetical protein